MFIGRLVCIIERDSWSVEYWVGRFGVVLRAYRRRPRPEFVAGNPISPALAELRPRDICLSAESDTKRTNRRLPGTTSRRSTSSSNRLEESPLGYSREPPVATFGRIQR